MAARQLNRADYLVPVKRNPGNTGFPATTVFPGENPMVDGRITNNDVTMIRGNVAGAVQGFGHPAAAGKFILDCAADSSLEIYIIMPGGPGSPSVRRPEPSYQAPPGCQ